MTELTCWPLDNKSYTSIALGAAYAARSRGLLLADSFSARTNGNNTLTFSKGVGCIHVSEFWAAFPFSTQDVTLTFTDADGAYPRWDAVVLGYDKNGNAAGLYVRDGMASQSPALPDIRRNDDYDELFLYRITRPAGATKIEAEHIVDLRMDPSCCGLMRDTLDAVDTSVMQRAFDDFLYKISQELDRLNADTETMQRTMYDPQGKNRDVFAYDIHLYKAELLLDNWQGEGPYTQTTALMPLDGGPAVQQNSLFASGPLAEGTDDADADAALMAALNDLNGAAITLGEGTVTVTLQTRPTVDLPAVWQIREV